MVLFPLLLGAMWAARRVPSESPGGQTPLAVPGWLRRGLELAILGLAIVGLFAARVSWAGWLLGTAVLLDYSLLPACRLAGPA